MTADPFTAFNFRVELRARGSDAPMCEAAFSACEGLEVRFDLASLREGGAPGVQRLAVRGVSYGHVTLRRGMTASFDLWEWCASVARSGGPRVDGRVVVLDADGRTERAVFRLTGCFPVKFSGPDFAATANEVAIEELELACEALALVSPGSDGSEDARTPERAELRELDPRFEAEINRKRWVRAQINPETLCVSYSNPQPESGGPGAARLCVELWFGVTEAAGARVKSQPTDVQRMTDAVAYFITPRRARGGELVAPAVRLAWGSFSFDGFVDSLEQTFEGWSVDGQPTRARLALSLTRPWISTPPSA